MRARFVDGEAYLAGVRRRCGWGGGPLFAEAAAYRWLLMNASFFCVAGGCNVTANETCRGRVREYNLCSSQAKQEQGTV